MPKAVNLQSVALCCTIKHSSRTGRNCPLRSLRPPTFGRHEWLIRQHRGQTPDLFGPGWSTGRRLAPWKGSGSQGTTTLPLLQRLPLSTNLWPRWCALTPGPGTKWPFKVWKKKPAPCLCHFPVVHGSLKLSRPVKQILPMAATVNNLRPTWDSCSKRPNPDWLPPKDRSLGTRNQSSHSSIWSRHINTSCSPFLALTERHEAVEVFLRMWRKPKLGVPCPKAAPLRQIAASWLLHPPMEPLKRPQFWKVDFEKPCLQRRCWCNHKGLTPKGVKHFLESIRPSLEQQ